MTQPTPAEAGPIRPLPQRPPAGRPSLRRRLLGLAFRLPMMITCREFEAFIVDYLEDGLSPSERRRFEMHLRVCRECREYIAAYRASMEAARQALGPDEVPVPLPEPVPEDLVAAVIASRETPSAGPG